MFSALGAHTMIIGCSDGSGSGSDGGSGGNDATTDDGSGSGGRSDDTGSGAHSGGAKSGSGGDKSGSGGEDAQGTGGDNMGGGAGESMGGSMSMGGSDASASGGSEGDEEPINYLQNPGFEAGTVGDKSAEIPNWSEDLDEVASYLETGGHSGAQRLTHWKQWYNDGDWYEVSTYQTVTGIPNGTYTFSMWVTRDEWFDDQYLFAEDFDDASTELTADTMPGSSNTAYIEVKITDIEVTNNQVTVGVYSRAPAGVWAGFDDASLFKQ